MKTSQKPLNLTLRSKVNVVPSMYATHPLMMIDSCTKDDMPMSKQKHVNVLTQTCQKPYKFDLEVKRQRRIGITNVRDALTHGDTPMCQIW